MWIFFPVEFLIQIQHHVASICPEDMANPLLDVLEQEFIMSSGNQDECFLTWNKNMMIYKCSKCLYVYYKPTG